jgi:hypothetical protein
MKNLIQKAALVLGVVLIAFTACKKQDLNEVVNATNDEATLVALVDQANNEMLTEDASTDAPEMGVARLDEGLAADYLVVASDFEDVQSPNGPDSMDDQRRHVKAHSFVACLRRLELSDRQKEAIKGNLAKYEDCKEAAIHRARAIHKKLVDQYQEKFMRLRKALDNGDITEEQFKEGVKKLRMAFNKELRSLQLGEKIDAAIKECYGKFLRNLKEILNERQWKAFVACHKR